MLDNYTVVLQRVLKMVYMRNFMRSIRTQEHPNEGEVGLTIKKSKICGNESTYER